MVSEAFTYAITMLEHELEFAHAEGEHAVFGSASLVMNGVIDRDPSDVDVFVSKRVWGLLLPRPRWYVLTPQAKDPPILATKMMKKEIHLFFDWYDPWLEIDVGKEIRDARWLEYDGCKFRCVHPSRARYHKEQAIRWPENSKRERHLADIAAIDRWLTV